MSNPSMTWSETRDGQKTDVAFVSADVFPGGFTMLRDVASKSYSKGTMNILNINVEGTYCHALPLLYNHPFQMNFGTP
jgi:hypothetical protein